MDWLFDRRGKSLAHSAQRVVADMHRHLDNEKKRNKELEAMIMKFQHLCTDSLESELQRLESKKKELLQEIDQIDTSIAQKRLILEKTKDDVRSILTSSKTLEPSTSSESILVGDSKIPDEKANELEEQYLEESEWLQNLRDNFSSVLFIVHRNDLDDVIGYSPCSTSTNLVMCCKIMSVSGSIQQVELSIIENMMTYGAKVVPNHDRDFPDVKDLSVPHDMLEKFSKQKSKQQSVQGQLVCAFEIPLIPDVVIDIWSTEQGNAWATTTIDNVNFAYLERIFLTSETVWGVSSLAQIDLFGRHPKKGYLLVESIIATTE